MLQHSQPVDGGRLLEEEGSVVLVQGDVWQGPFKNETVNTNDVTLEVVSVTTENKIFDFTNKVCELAPGSVDGFVLFVDCRTAMVLEKQKIFSSVPTVVVIRDFCHVTSTRMIQLRPDCTYSNTLLADIAASKLWRNVLLYFDTTYRSLCLTNLLMQLSLNSVSTRMVKTNNYAGPLEYLPYIDRHSPDGIFVLTATDTMEDIISQGQVGSSNFPWVLMSGDTQLVNRSQYNDSFVVLLRNQFKDLISDQETCRSNHSRYLDSEIYLSDATKVMLEIFSEVVISKNIKALEPMDCRQKSLPSNRTHAMEVFKTFQQNHVMNYSEYQICSTENSLTDSWKYMGNWSKDNGISLVTSRLFGNEFIDFNNATLKVAALPLDPFVFFNIDDNNQTTYSGFCIDILDQLALKFNFNYEIVSPADNAYGSLEDDGTWNGMVGMVMSNDADFAAGPFTITSARESVIDFTTTYMEEGIGILTMRPKEEENKEYKMFKPLSVTVWVMIGVAIVIVGVLVYVNNRYSPVIPVTKPEDNEPQQNPPKLTSSMWNVYGYFVEQGGDERPRSLSGRLILSVWWMFTILMLATYTANLAAYLTVTIIDSPINSLEELANHADIRPLIFSGSNLQTLFKTAKSSVYGQIWSKMSGMPIVKDIDTTLSYVRTNEYAFLSDFSLLEYIMLQDCQTYAMADEKFNNAGFGFVLEENSLYLNAFNLAILKMNEAGLIEKWRKQWWSLSDDCTSSDRTGSAQSLGLDSIVGLYYVYFGVVGLAVFAFLIELICSRKIVQRWISVQVTKLNAVKTMLINRLINRDSDVVTLVK
ncbi:glutamate receptor 4-like [Mytilus edulis]|uniref:glutamate receptor 4-like n=1 Tax=Mytilus edulis TaxID=6550 RepID=UPI0039EEFC54